MQTLNGIVGVAVVASVLMGLAVAFIRNFSAGPHREPLWFAAAISAGIGATMTTVAYVLKDADSGSIWQIMALGAVCGALGSWSYALFQFRGEKFKNPVMKIERKAQTDFRMPY